MFLGLEFRLLQRFCLTVASEESPCYCLLRATDINLEGLEVSHHKLGARQPYRNREKCCQHQDDARAAELNWDGLSSEKRNLADTTGAGRVELRKPAPPAAAKVWSSVSAAAASRGSGARRRCVVERRLRPEGTLRRGVARPAPGPAHHNPRLLARHSSRPTAAAGVASSACSCPTTTAVAAAPICPSRHHRRSRRRARAAAPAPTSHRHRKLLGEGQVEQL